jgi:hypothetical protein
MNYESENRVVVQRWGRLLPTIGGGSSLAYMYFALDLVPLSALLSPRTTPEASEDMDVSACETGGQCRGFTPLGVRMIAQLAGGNLSLIPTIRAVMMKYRNIVRMNDSYYIARRPIKTACSSVVCENDMVYVTPDKYCRNRCCGCSRLKKLIVKGLYTIEHAYSIADIRLELTNYDIITGRNCTISADETQRILQRNCVRDVHQQRELYRMINKIAEIDTFGVRMDGSVQNPMGIEGVQMIPGRSTMIDTIEVCASFAKEILEELQRVESFPLPENTQGHTDTIHENGCIDECAQMPGTQTLSFRSDRNLPGCLGASAHPGNLPDTVNDREPIDDLMDISTVDAELAQDPISRGPSKEARMARAARMEDCSCDDITDENTQDKPAKKVVVVRNVRKIPAKPAKQTPKRAAKTRQANPPDDGRGRRWSSNETEQLKSEYAAGVPIREIAKLHRRTEPSIRSMITNAGFRFLPARSSKYV